MPAAGTKPYGTRYNVPAGVILPYVGQEAPPGWLLCYGQSVLKSDYPELYAKVGTKFGAGTSTTFVLPDLRGRVIAGRDNMGGVSANRFNTNLPGDTLGATTGTEINIGASEIAAASIGSGGGYTTSSLSTSIAQPTMVLDHIIKT